MQTHQITKQYITDNLIRKDGRLNNRKIHSIPKDITIEDLYLIYNDIEKPTCINGHFLIFVSFNKGYKNSCENLECTKKRAYKNRKQDYNKIHEKVRKTKMLKYNNEYYVNVQKRKETRKNRKNNGTQYTINPIKNIHNLNKDYITKNFIIHQNGQKLDKLKFMEYFDCKETFMYKKLIELDIKYKKTDSYIEHKINKLFNNIFEVNNRQIIKPFELDLYHRNSKFALEYNGLIWHSYGKSKHSMFNNTNEDKNRHLNKTLLCEEKGIQLYNIFENEWLNENKRAIWLSMINNKLGLNTRIGARKCTIKEVKTQEARKFIDENHLQGYSNSSIKIGLYYKNELFSIMTFGKSRYNKDIEYELIRFCTKKNYTVQGGGSKLLKYFERKYKPKSLLSYANRRWSCGDFYIGTGFTFSHDTAPNYFYFLEDSGGSGGVENSERILWSRNKFQKHKLSKELDKFDCNLTETENMYNNGYRKIYDCGNKVYIKMYKDL